MISWNGSNFNPTISSEDYYSGAGWGDWVNTGIASFGGSTVAAPNTGGGPDIKQQLTTLANQTEAALAQNRDDFAAGRVPASQAYSQGWGLFDGMISQMLRMGPQGQVSAEERDRRLNSPRLKWDWIAYYLDPLGGTPPPAPISTPIGGGVPGSTLPPYQAGIPPTGLGGIDSKTLIIGALVLVGALMIMGRRRG